MSRGRALWGRLDGRGSWRLRSREEEMSRDTGCEATRGKGQGVLCSDPSLKVGLAGDTRSPTFPQPLFPWVG